MLLIPLSTFIFHLNFMKEHYDMLVTNQNMVPTERAGLVLPQPWNRWLGSHPSLKGSVGTKPALSATSQPWLLNNLWLCCFLPFWCMKNGLRELNSRHWVLLLITSPLIHTNSIVWFLNGPTIITVYWEYHGHGLSKAWTLHIFIADPLLSK